MRGIDRVDTARSDPAALVRSRLDRAVGGGWFGRALAAASIAAGGLAVAIAAGAAAELLTPRLAGPWRWIAATLGGLSLGGLSLGVLSLGAALAGGAAARGRWRSRRPRAAVARLDRLGVALATERRHPWLGERISRAVGFLDDPADRGDTAPLGDGPARRDRLRATERADHPPQGDDPLTRGLRRLAIAQAAEGLDAVPRLAVPGAEARRRWIGAGFVTAAAVAASAWAGPPAWRAAIRGSVFGAAVADARRETAPPAHPAAAVAMPTDPAAAIAAARHAVQVLRAALSDDKPLPDDRRSRLAARARNAAAAADAALAMLWPDDPPALLPLLAAGLGDVARSLARASVPAEPAAAAGDGTDNADGPDGAARARAVLAHLVTASTAADRLAAAAEVEVRLAAVLSRGFARAPGADAHDLSADMQGGLDRLAEIAAECRRTVAADGRGLRAATDAIVRGGIATDAALPAASSVVRRGCDRLDAVAVEATAPLPGHVAANRLGRAATIAAEAAQEIAALAAALGTLPTGGPPAPSVGGPPDAASITGAAATTGGPQPPGPLDRTRARLELAAATILAPLDEVAATAGGPPEGTAGAGEWRDRPADAQSTDAQSTGGQAAAAGRTPAGGTPAGNTPTAGAAGTGVAAGGATVADAAPSAAERVWMLLPRRERPDAPANAAEREPAAYRPAIDAYYRLLLQSLSPPAGRPAARNAAQAGDASPVTP